MFTCKDRTALPRRISTCSTVRHQVENVTRFGVDVEADVHVTSGQVDDEVRVVVHWVRNTELVTHGVPFTCNTAAFI